ncbi:hypothetical protein [uncultured Rhodospira sp.]|uniref:hypothetical protein n=1 Tax=uncultured Rhodospira sp. TaxID=1936189 RepID=UPI002613D2CD|nr:hypothetical protein [uncultured Rhodospira sp.]
MVSLAAQEWMAEGEKLGEARGEARGEMRAMRQALRRTLTLRFGPLPDDVATRLDSLPPDALDSAFDRAVTAPDLAGVFGTGPQGPAA